jgi:hypothetical protein
MSHEDHRPLDEFERQLAALRPASGLDRDALLYAAGRAAGEASAAERKRPAHSTTRWLSPLVIAASLLTAATFAALWWNESTSGPPHVVQSNPNDKEFVPPADETGSDTSSSPRSPIVAPKQTNFHLRHVALSEGIDAWPQRWPGGGGSPPPTPRTIMPLGDS